MPNGRDKIPPTIYLIADNKSDDNRDDKGTAGSGDNPVRAKIKDLQDPSK